jgi:hypothetical protein
LTQTVNGSTSTTTLTSSVNPSVFGQTVTLTAMVTGPGSGTPTGTVSFFDGSTLLGTSAMTGGQGTLSVSGFTGGNHTLTATYGGDSNFGSSTSGAITQTVNKGSTSTTVVSSLNPSSSGDPVTFTATVTPVAPASGTATGTVIFKDGTTTLGTGTLNSQGKATFTTSTLAVGTHTITAVYNGDSNFTGSTSAQLLQVVQSNTLIRQPLTSAVPARTGLSGLNSTIVAGISLGSKDSQQFAALTRPTTLQAQTPLPSNLGMSIVDDFFSSVGRGEETNFLSASSRLKRVLNQVLSSLFGF